VPLGLTAADLEEEFLRVTAAISSDPGEEGATYLEPAEAMSRGGDAAAVCMVKGELDRSDNIRIWAFNLASAAQALHVPGKLDLVLSTIAVAMVIGYGAGRRAVTEEQELERLMGLNG
jgi:hypothetical protein